MIPPEQNQLAEGEGFERPTLPPGRAVTPGLDSHNLRLNGFRDRRTFTTNRTASLSRVHDKLNYRSHTAALVSIRMAGGSFAVPFDALTSLPPGKRAGEV